MTRPPEVLEEQVAALAEGGHSGNVEREPACPHRYACAACSGAGLLAKPANSAATVVSR